MIETEAIALSQFVGSAVANELDNWLKKKEEVIQETKKNFDDNVNKILESQKIIDNPAIDNQAVVEAAVHAIQKTAKEAIKIARISAIKCFYKKKPS